MPATPSTATCGAVRNPAGRAENAEDHRYASLAGERSEVRGRAAELGYDARHARQHLTQRRPGDLRDKDVAHRRRARARIRSARRRCGPRPSQFRPDGRAGPGVEARSGRALAAGSTRSGRACRSFGPCRPAPIRSRPGRRQLSPPSAAWRRAPRPARPPMLASQASRVGTGRGPRPRPWTHWSRCGFRPASIDITRPIRSSAMRSGTTSPCASAEPSPQVAETSISPSARLAEAAAGGLSLDQRLDQDGHRSSGRRKPMRLHVAACVRGPQRRPAGAHRGEEFGLVAQAKEALELAGETRARAVLDERGGAHDAERGRRALGPPGVDERLEDGRRDRSLMEREPDPDRQPEAG